MSSSSRAGLSSGQASCAGPDDDVSPTGLSILHQPAAGLIDVDIVFVHGIQGHPRRTWEYNHDGRAKAEGVSTSTAHVSTWRRLLKRAPKAAKSMARPSVFWPRDLLPQKCPTARIMTWGYDSIVTKGYAAADQGSIFTHAKDLLYTLERNRPLKRGVVFVAHSLGGIIVKEVLRRSESSEESSVRDILESLTAVVFLGTPHRGSPGLASTADVLRRISQTVLRFDANPTLLRALGLDSPELDLCRETFLTQWRQREFRVKTFQEGKGVTGVNLGTLNNKVVPDTSSSLDVPKERAETISSNHMDMCRFFGSEDSGYQKVSGEISVVANAQLSQIAACSQALAFENVTTRQFAIQPPLASTTEWFFSHTEYHQWITQTEAQSARRLLWVKGRPGSGKSTIMKEAARRLKMMATRPPPVVAAFYFNARGSELEKSPIGMLRSLILQLFDQDEAIRRIVLSYFSGSVLLNPEGWFPSREELQTLLVQGLQATHSEPRRVFILVDALDECGEKSVRDVAHFLRGLVNHHSRDKGLTLDVCLSSRHYPTITVSNCSEIVVENANERDIAHYIDTKINLELMSNTSMVDRVRSLLLQKSSGIFLWVILVVEIVLNSLEDGRSDQDIEETLRDVPDDLAALYQDLFAAIPERDREKSTLLVYWVLLSRRQLLPADIHVTQILSMESVRSLPEAMEKFQSAAKFAPGPDDNVERTRRLVRSLSRGLVEVWDSKVQFIHETVRQFFLDDAARLFGGPRSLALGHALIMKASLHGLCIIQLTKSPVRATLPMFGESFQLDWLQDYIRDFLIDHAAQLRKLQDVPHRLAHTVWQIVEVINCRPIEYWVPPRIVRDGPAIVAIRMQDDEVSKVLFDHQLFSFIVKAAIIVDQVVQHLSPTAKPFVPSLRSQALLSALQPSADDWIRDYPSRWASRVNVSSEVSEVQLASTHRTGTMERALWAVSKISGRMLRGPAAQLQMEVHIVEEREKLLRIQKLLSRGETLQVVDEEGSSPLHYAAWQGMARIVDLLVDRGHGIDVQNDDNLTPLFLACQYGHFETASRLLHMGANTSLTAADGNTPLHIAARSSNIALTKALVDAGAPVDAENAQGRTPLHLAVYYRAEKDLVSYLLGTGGAMSTKTDEFGMSPITLAGLDGSRAIDASILSDDPRHHWTGHKTNFQKMMASRIGHRDDQEHLMPPPFGLPDRPRSFDPENETQHVFVHQEAPF